MVGAQGPNAANVNGVYEPVDEAYNGKVLFRKRGDADKWLRYTTTQKWVVSSTASKDANNTTGWCMSVELGLASPMEVSSWEIAVGGKFVAQATIATLPIVRL